MKIIYGLRVALLSFEALILSLIPASIYYLADNIEKFSSGLSINDEVMKTILLLPLVLSAWIINELRQLLIEDKDTTKILTAWPDYWRLKAHVHTSLIYMVIFAILSLLPWGIEDGLKSGTGLIIFATSLLGQLILALNVYNARIRIREIISSLS